MADATQPVSDFMGDHLSVKMFGAVCDGATDDTAAVNAAIAASVSLKRDLLIPGLCGISSTILIPAYACIRGVGMSELSTPKCGFKKLADVVALRFGGVDIHLRDLSVIGKTGGDTTDGIWVGDATNNASMGELHRVYVANHGGYGILFGQGNGVKWDVVCVANGKSGVYMGDPGGHFNSNESRGIIVSVGNGGAGVEIQSGSSGNTLMVDCEGNTGPGVLCNWTYNQISRAYTEANAVQAFVSISNITRAFPAVVTASAWHGLRTGSAIGFTAVVGMTEINGAAGKVVTVTGAPISAITQANPAAVTTSLPHGLTTGQTVGFTRDVGGMTQIRGLAGTVTVTGTNTCTVNIDSSAFSAFTGVPNNGTEGWIAEATTFTVNEDTTAFSAYTSGGKFVEQIGVQFGASAFGSSISGNFNEGPAFQEPQFKFQHIWDAQRATLSFPVSGVSSPLAAPSLSLDASPTGGTQIFMRKASSQGSTVLLQVQDVSTSNHPFLLMLASGAFQVYNGFQSFRYNSGKYGEFGFHPTNDYLFINAFDSNAGTEKPIVIGEANANSRIMLHGDTDDGTTPVQVNGNAKVSGTLKTTGAFGANGTTPQTAAASGGAVTPTPTNTTPYGFASSADFNALVTLLGNIRSALVANGIMS